eukprot:CAMPEP_0172644354 /NCGR_PEP_ID=MMETSP1068-20121228/239168_1 /TAXON_ID=35684 /ORGANISM="Pseudopedinella elastica, Strain CCMP716" /LENGTH=88 /DNA_ID=CAMNT_0013458547 /DNA_START=672 /DNA_END=935 /DNA_ORIENTATION=-
MPCPATNNEDDVSLRASSSPFEAPSFCSSLPSPHDLFIARGPLEEGDDERRSKQDPRHRMDTPRPLLRMPEDCVVRGAVRVGFAWPGP